MSIVVERIDWAGGLDAYRELCKDPAVKAELESVGSSRADDIAADIAEKRHGPQNEPCAAGHLWTTRSGTPAYSIHLTTEVARVVAGKYGLLHW